MTRREITTLIETVNNYLNEKYNSKDTITQERYAGRAYEQLHIFKKYYPVDIKMDNEQLEQFEEMLTKAYEYSVITYEEYNELFDMVNVREAHMTITEAQELLNKEGFAWSVIEVSNGDRFNSILCDWQGEEHIVYYSNAQGKIVKITS